MNSGASWNERGLSPDCTRQRARPRDAPECRSRNGSIRRSAAGRTREPNPRHARKQRPHCAAHGSPTRSPSSTPASNSSPRDACPPIPAAALPSSRSRRLRCPPIRSASIRPSPKSPRASARSTRRRRTAVNLGISRLSGACGSGDGFLQSRAPARHITAQIETLRQPGGVEDAIASLRADLADIARALERGAAAPHARRPAGRHACAGRTDRAHLRPRRRLPRCRHRASPQRGPRRAQRDDAGRRACWLRPARIRTRATRSTVWRMARPTRRCCVTSKPRSTNCANSRRRRLGRRRRGAGRRRAGARHAHRPHRGDHRRERSRFAGAARHELTHALDTRVEKIGPLPHNLAALVSSLTDKLNRADGRRAIRPPSSSSNGASWASPTVSRPRTSAPAISARSSAASSN